jgi:non-reducing end alpha-L-arabinofuranosidase
MMTVRPRSRYAGRALLALAATVTLAAGALLAVGAGTPSRAATQGPCDIYATAGTPCVAAHSTTRALFAAYSGPLYQVRRSSDNATTNISPLSAGGVANAGAQDSFCSGTSCVITEIFDQTGRGNNLTQAPGGGAAGGPDNLANATAAPTTLNGQKAYGVFIAPGTGYRNDRTSGIATGDSPEGEYAIFDGTHFNGGCCFDYGNAETNNNDDGNGTMEAISFGNIRVWGFGSGNGPWIMADLENGLFAADHLGLSTNDPTTSFRFTTAVVKGQPGNFAIRGGNAQSGGLSTFWNGGRPSPGYNPMRKQGAIILGIGGDNSKGAQGTFYEGVMTSGFPTDATENSVQANITAAGYGSSVSTGNTVSVTSPGNQAGTVGTAASVQVQASDSASGQTLSYSASGLPAGLSINSGTGLITGTLTAAGTSSVTVTARDGTGATGSASFTWTVSTGQPGGTCHVTYTKNSEWPGGFTAQVVIANTGTTAINGWSLTFAFPGDQKITSNFNGGFSQSGANATLTNASYNGTIAPGAAITDGFQGTWTSNDNSPASFSVNGTACTS